MQHYLFSQIDSWFFRESRSMDGSGASALASIFPPANQTLLGALRTQIGAQYFRKHGGSWQTFTADSELSQIIGYSQDYAQLQAQGAWLYHSGEKALYFPAPLNLVQQGDSSDDAPLYDFFTYPDTAVQTDLGNVRLPQLRTRSGGLRDKPLEQYWISASDYRRVLSGKAPEALVAQSSLITDDPRLGISRDNQTRRTEDGMLYQTNHCRLQPQWQIYLGLNGVSEEYRLDTTMLRFGGEARMAALDRLENAPALPEPPAAGSSQNLILYLLTPLPDSRENKSAPPLPNSNFTRHYDEQSQHHFWRGELAGVEINIISGVIGKLQRIGGWDMAKHQSLPVRSYLPAGSCWYIHCDSSAHATQILTTLHAQYITSGSDRAQGYGEIAVGLAPTTHK